MKGKPDVLFIVSPIPIDSALKLKILHRYKLDVNKNNISSILNKNDETRFFFFCGSNKLIYQSDGLIRKDYIF